jgi:hypothetical protein
VVFDWRDARTSDRSVRQSFECTVDFERTASGRPLFHPRPYEREVQTHIRRAALPSSTNGCLRLGFADGELAAVVQINLEGTRDGYSFVRLQAVAIARQFRGLRGEAADEAMHEALLQSIVLGPAGASEGTVVSALIDVRNEPSRRMLQRHKFALRGTIDGQLEEWVVLAVR